MNQKSSESPLHHQLCNSFHSVPHHTSKEKTTTAFQLFYWTIPTPLVAFDDQQAVSQLFIFEDTPPSGKRPEFRQFAKSNLPIPNRHRSFLFTTATAALCSALFFLLTL
ncbi:putative molybdopterin-guanine dinucleotide biosynthesis protein [Trichinella spiralis]|uniref:putative molybdopterin-guanine dinucleotide biosynthesis protein n=1 Tax=Trichinella spiralis TaxID=6334 RepID=UPI0001EFB926|nr:putative molybdopterin-guanine dinucleotide biosynthesis protein [Trichinella spiralis]